MRNRLQASFVQARAGDADGHAGRERAPTVPQQKIDACGAMRDVLNRPDAQAPL
jgi:hypothetical protein